MPNKPSGGAQGPGTDLAKVLWYYNLLPDTHAACQKILCPFHQDANPSLLVNLEDGTWFCFGCNRSGDAAKFVQYMEKGLNDLQALKRYHEILKSDKCSSFSPAHFAKSRRKPRSELYAQAYDYYHGLRRVNWKHDDEQEVAEAREYMEHRGFSTSTLSKAKAKVTYNKSYGIIFPMLDNGKFRGWVCRTMVKEIEQRRKYLYNEGFSRATTLVGDYGSKDYVFVVEGYMDRLKFVQCGYDNVVAILGWRITDEQVQKLKEKGITKVVSALDNDECGKRGTKYLSRFFEVVRFTYLKGLKDPGDMTQPMFDKMFARTMGKLSNGGYNDGSRRQNQK